MILQPAPTSSKNFHYSHERKTFIAEASELGRNFKMDQVYDDACDIGFTIVSAKTGRKAVFRIESVEEDEGDLMSWNFVCVTPGYKDLKATIFND